MFTIEYKKRLELSKAWDSGFESISLYRIVYKDQLASEWSTDQLVIWLVNVIGYPLLVEMSRQYDFSICRDANDMYSVRKSLRNVLKLFLEQQLVSALFAECEIVRQSALCVLNRGVVCL